MLANLPTLKKLWIWHFFHVPAPFVANAIAAVPSMKLTQLGFLQGRIEQWPNDVSSLAGVKHVEIGVELPTSEHARLAKAVPHLQMR